ncbi:MAG: hypothetical protein PHR75_03335 [Sulfurovum sp.]|nr:hypothetical protein [Sulfurovum sp.]MDD3602490.1 hypothetical protein [Sulfurovum sp.]
MNSITLKADTVTIKADINNDKSGYIDPNNDKSGYKFRSGAYHG